MSTKFNLSIVWRVNGAIAVWDGRTWLARPNSQARTRTGKNDFTVQSAVKLADLFTTSTSILPRSKSHGQCLLLTDPVLILE